MKTLFILFIQNNLEIMKDTVNQSVETSSSNNINWWMWVSIIELGVISFLILKKRYQNKNSKKIKFKKESLKKEIDFDNIINSSFNSDKLYDELKVKCHPDRFPKDDNLNKIADNLFQHITKNKNNLKVLLELKKEAVEKLNINFKN